MASRRTVYVSLVRHAQTELNAIGVLQGQGVDATLNDVGIQQAQKLAKRLQNESFTHVFASDLLRAQQTCRIILLQGNHDSTTSVVLDQRLRERSYGVFEGHCKNELLSAAKQAGLTKCQYIPLDGEAMVQVEQRGIEFLEHLCSLHSSFIGDRMNVLMVTHGGFIRRFIASLSAYYHAHFPNGKLGSNPNNTSLTQLQISLSRHYNQVDKTRIVSNVDVKADVTISKGVHPVCDLLYCDDHLNDDDCDEIINTTV